MSFSIVRRLVFVALAAAAFGWLYQTGLDPRDLVRLASGTPHQRYTVALKYRGTAKTAAGTAWLDSAERSLATAAPVTLPHQTTLVLSQPGSTAAAYAMPLRRGQRYVVDAQIDGRQPQVPVFVDVFEREGTALRHSGSAPEDSTSLALEIGSDGDYVIRIQSPLDEDVRLALTLRAEPTLRLPVERSKPASIQSFFGDSRDGGRRTHHGVDIFARRGTPVIAAADGIVSSVGTNGLGGNVVWIARPGRREMHYYAHLDQQLVKPGTLVEAGEVIGTVGNTGNANRTAPHLHFGIYSAGGPVDPLPYIAPSRQVEIALMTAAGSSEAITRRFRVAR
jgi:murein DD-endopeptidase MepM/ murein hydrolase activator NlpD